MKIKKAYLLIVLFLCGLSVGNVCASASAAAAAEEAAAPVAGYLGAELGEAVRNGNEPEVERLIAAGADVNAADQQNGWAALMEAVINGHENIVDQLLQAGAEVNAITKLGRTALMYAAIMGHENIVKMLLQAGADKDIQNVDGLTAADLARNDKIANMIRDFVLPSGRLTKAAR